MQVILKADVKDLGAAGEIVNVSPGFARNYLIPRDLALVALEGSVRDVEHKKAMAEAIRRKQLEAAKALAAKLTGTVVSVQREAGEDQKLFGSVTKRDIVDALAADGYEVDRHAVMLDDNIRTVGIHTVAVQLAAGVEAEIKVYVIAA